jgi:hypothetical protein
MTATYTIQAGMLLLVATIIACALELYNKSMLGVLISGKDDTV